MLDQINVVSMSGGKDSTATALVALERRAGNLRFIFADTGHEHPQTYEHIDYLERELGHPIERVKADYSGMVISKRTIVEKKWRKDGVPEKFIENALQVLKPTGNPFLDLCLAKGRFPSTRRRFCSEFLKHKPLNARLMEMLEEAEEVINWQGVRRDESLQRANLLEEEDHPEHHGLVWYRPILDWTAEECFAIAKRHGLEPNPLYKEGMLRVGCMPCIHASKKETFEIAIRFPEELERLAEWERLVSQASRAGVSTFFDVRVVQQSLGLPKITSENLHTVTPETHGVHQYVEWSKTTHGGKQYDLIKAMEIEEVNEGPTCKSAYGLCE